MRAEIEGGGDVLDIELRGMHPLSSIGSSLPRRWPVLRPTDGPVFDAYRSRPAAFVPNVIRRRYRSGVRTARTLAAHFSDAFSLSMTDASWRAPHFEIVGNEHEWYILSLRLSGDTVESINGHDHRFGPYSCYLVRYARGMRYVFRSVSDHPLVEVCVTFRPTVMAERLGVSIEDLNRQFHLLRNPWYSECRMTPAMLGILREIRRTSPSAPGYRFFAEAKTLELLALYVAALHGQPNPRAGSPAGEMPRLHRVRRHLEENFDRMPSLDELAGLVGLGRKALTTAFKREFGQTVHEYHRSVRMDVAKALLREEESSIIEIAQRLGYGYPANFTKAFLQHTGISPRAYRRGADPVDEV